MLNLKLEILSPSGVIFKGDCAMVVVPSAAGEIGVMKGHEAFITNLQEGQVAIYNDQQEIIKSFEVKAGFAEMQSEEKLLVLLDS
jgi:F-type H+-transporting ATPase subunit epsilon